MLSKRNFIDSQSMLKLVKIGFCCVLIFNFKNVNNGKNKLNLFIMKNLKKLSKNELKSIKGSMRAADIECCYNGMHIGYSSSAEGCIAMVNKYILDNTPK